jgi:hypothetical protein
MERKEVRAWGLEIVPDLNCLGELSRASTTLSLKMSPVGASKVDGVPPEIVPTSVMGYNEKLVLMESKIQKFMKSDELELCR